MKTRCLQKLSLRREKIRVRGLDSTTHHDSESLARLAQNLTRGEVQEVSLAFLLNNQNCLIGYTELARGGLDWVRWDPRILFATVLLSGATRLVMCHNHSSSPRPSRADVAGMKRLIPAADLLGLVVQDHIVVSPDQWVSMDEFGLLPKATKLIEEQEAERERKQDGLANDRRAP